MRDRLSKPLGYLERERSLLVSGGVNPALARDIAEESLEVELGETELKRHGDGEMYARIISNVRGKDVFIIQSHKSANGYSIQDAIVEHQLLVQAAKDSDARNVTAVVPYLGYSRSDRKSKGREAVGAKWAIQGFENAGADRMISVDLHSPQTTNIFRGSNSYDHLIAGPELRFSFLQELGEKTIKNCVVVAPDEGALKLNSRHVEELSRLIGSDLPRAGFMPKDRGKSDSTSITRGGKIPGVEGKTALVVDDMIDGGSTMVSGANLLRESGANSVIVAATHAVFSGSATEKLMDDSIDKVFVTDTLPVEKAKEEMGDKLKIAPIYPVIGRAIFEILTPGGSISKLFDDQNHF